MDRRTFLGGASALLAAVAGCTGSSGEVPETAPDPPEGIGTRTQGSGGFDGGDGDGGSETTPVVGLENYTGVADDDGTLIVRLTVTNVGGQTVVRYLRAVVELENEDRAFGRFVRLAPGETKTVDVETDVAYRNWQGLVPSVVRRTPATPLPTETPTDSATPTPTPQSQSATAASGGDTVSGTTRNGTESSSE